MIWQRTFSACFLTKKATYRNKSRNERDIRQLVLLIKHTHTKVSLPKAEGKGLLCWDFVASQSQGL